MWWGCGPVAEKKAASVGGREVGVAGMFFCPLLPFSCPLLVEVAYRAWPRTTDSVLYFPGLWLKQTSGSYAQLPTLAWEMVSSRCMLQVLWGVGILLAQGPLVISERAGE